MTHFLESYYYADCICLYRVWQNVQWVLVRAISGWWRLGQLVRALSYMT